MADNEKLTREEAKRDNHPPLYKKKEIEEVMNLFTTISYNEKIEITQGISLVLKNAGHILGSAIAEIEAEGKKIAYTSDLGNTPSELLDPPEFIEKADFVICESTYGGRVHENRNERQQKLAKILNTIITGKGVLMIPSFAIERTQELLHDIDHFCQIENCQKPSFFLDSPLAEKVTQVFKKYPQYLNKEIQREFKNNNFFGLERVKITSAKEESQAIFEKPNPKVIIAGSGMLNGGLIFTSFSPFKSTLGRRLLNGEKEVKIFGQKVQVRSQIVAIGSYSAHADSPQIINWLKNITGLKNVFIVHGESDQQLNLARQINLELHLPSQIPQQGEKFEL